MSAMEPRNRELPDSLSAEGGRIAFQARIGVTGHRSLAHQEEPARIVHSRLSEILACCQGSEATPVVLTILSALADGADRLVVEAARTLAKATGIQFRLQAVLPLAVEDYREDFDPHTSRPGFDELLAGADVRVQMPPTGDRDEAYESAGRYIVDHSDVMVALWDGARSGGRGGTAEIVSYAREQGVPVLVVPASRAGEQPHLPAEAAEDDNLPAKLESMSEAFARVDEYNRRSVASGELRRRLAVEQERFREALHGTSIHSQYEIVAAWALPHFVRADRLAIKYQRLHYRAAAWLYGLAAFAVAAIAAQSQFRAPAAVALAEIVFMAGVLGTLGFAHRRGLHDRWLGYRSLAEGFRSAMFITMTGAPDRRDGETGDVDAPWYQRAFSEAWTTGRPSVAAQEMSPDGLRRFLIAGWIEDQIRYHRNAVERFRRRRSLLNRVVLVLFTVTIVLAILHTTQAIVGSFWSPMFVFLAILFPSVGAALTGVRDLHQYRLHEHRSTRTAERLERLKRQMESHTSLDSLQKLAAETQTVIESENLGWCGVIEFQDLELVI